MFWRYLYIFIVFGNTSGCLALSLKGYHIKCKIFEIKKIIEHKLCVLIFSTTYSATFLILRRIQRRYWQQIFIGIYVKYPLICHILKKLEFSRQIFAKYSNIKFHKNPSSMSRAVRWYGRKDTWTNMIKVTVNFPKFSKASKTAIWP